MYSLKEELSYNHMKTRKQPLFFTVVRIFLVLGIVNSALMVLLLAGITMFDTISSSFAESEIYLDVRNMNRDTTHVELTDSVAYAFEKSKTGELIVRMPWYTQLFVPFGFVNIPAFELSIPYWIFYSVVCFLLHRIISSTYLESPFSHKNIKRVLWIGYTLILYDVFTIARFFLLSIYVEELTNNQFRYDGLGPLIYFKVGILVIVIAMIYRRGVALQHEQELTI